MLLISEWRRKCLNPRDAFGFRGKYFRFHRADKGIRELFEIVFLGMVENIA